MELPRRETRVQYKQGAHTATKHRQGHRAEPLHPFCNRNALLYDRAALRASCYSPTAGLHPSEPPPAHPQTVHAHGCNPPALLRSPALIHLESPVSLLSTPKQHGLQNHRLPHQQLLMHSFLPGAASFLQLGSLRKTQPELLQLLLLLLHAAAVRARGSRS